MRYLGAMAAAWGLVGPAAAQDDAAAAARMRADVKFLASDRLEGRGIGTRGEEQTVDFLAEQFAKAGLRPAFGKNWFQPVPLVKIVTKPSTSLEAVRDGRSLAFRLEADFAGLTRTQKANDVFDAEAVFVGHGIVAPEFGWNDYAGVDVRGKVVVMFTNEPPSTDPKFFGGPALTYYGRWSYRFEEAARQGAVAAFIIHTPETAGYPYSVVQKLDGAQLEHPADAPALAFAGWLSQASGDALLGLSGKTVDAALKAADTRGFKAYSLGTRLKGAVASDVRKIVTRNVVGVVDGADPTLKDEAVIFTAHWDHLGVGRAFGGDAIYNGAMDNATGCSLLLESAREWASRKARPKRSAIFLATTAEENGLLGAYHYAKHPAFPLGKTSLNVNFDTVAPMGVPESVTVGGAERTTAWPIVKAAAQRFRLDIQPDKSPHLGFYYRSDHFALARGGVPAFSIWQGDRFRGKTPEEVAQAGKDYIGKRYHTPQDEYREDWDFSGFPTLIRFALDIATEAANAPGLPTWLPGDEFRAVREASGVR